MRDEAKKEKSLKKSSSANLDFSLLRLLLGVFSDRGSEGLLENELVWTQSSLKIITSFLANYELGLHLFIYLMARYIK